MDREQASEALQVLRRVVSQTRDDTALQNWGAIWMVQGVANGAAFFGTGVMLERGYVDPPPFVGLWGSVIALDIVVALALKKRRAGVRSYVESQLWAIWTTFIAAVSLVAVLNHAMELEAFFLGPVIAVLAAVSCASMGSLMGRTWFVGTAVFATASVAMAIAPAYQFAILGATWGAAQFVAGLWMHRAKSSEAQLV